MPDGIDFGQSIIIEALNSRRRGSLWEEEKIREGLKMVKMAMTKIITFDSDAPHYSTEK